MNIEIKEKQFLKLQKESYHNHLNNLKKNRLRKTEGKMDGAGILPPSTFGSLFFFYSKCVLYLVFFNSHDRVEVDRMDQGEWLNCKSLDAGGAP